MTRRRRWSDNLEAQRGGAETAARETAARLTQAEDKAAAIKSLILNNPDLALHYLSDLSMLIAQSSARQERIIRLMGEARQGLGKDPEA
jgi:hypothetical protein